MIGSIPADKKKLARIFTNRNIPTDAIAFYNHPSFQAEEQKDAAFLELYGAWVRLRPRDAAYDAHVRHTIPRIVDILSPEIARDPQKGVCIDASMMLTKMLELEGIWCYGAKGALKIESSKLECPTHFYLFDDHPVAGHVWVVAPPFEIVDVALGNQLFSCGEEKFIPQSLVAEEPARTVPQATDYFSTSLLGNIANRNGPLTKDIHLRSAPGLARTTTFFPSFDVELDQATLRYAVGGVTVSDGPSLYSIRSRKWNGRLPGELYDELVRPALSRT